MGGHMGGLHDFSVSPSPLFGVGPRGIGTEGLGPGVLGLRVWGQSLTVLDLILNSNFKSNQGSVHSCSERRV